MKTRRERRKTKQRKREGIRFFHRLKNPRVAAEPISVHVFEQGKQRRASYGTRHRSKLASSPPSLGKKRREIRGGSTRAPAAITIPLWRIIGGQATKINTRSNRPPCAPPACRRAHVLVSAVTCAHPRGHISARRAAAVCVKIDYTAGENVINSSTNKDPSDACV